MQGLAEDYREDNGSIDAVVCGCEDYEVDIQMNTGFFVYNNTKTNKNVNHNLLSIKLQ